MKPRVSIIVLNYNGGEVIRTCLNSLLKNTSYSNYKILIVDNGSTDGSLDIIRKEFSKLQLLELPQNIGFSKGMNAGAWHAIAAENPDYILFLSNDVSIPNNQKKWLEILVNDLEYDSKAATAGPKSLRPDGGIDETGSYFTNSIRGKPKITAQGEIKQKVHLTTGACILAKTSVLKKIGFYDERFSPYWFEDTDLFARIRKAGYAAIYDPAAKITHLGSHSINKEKKRSAGRVKTIEYKNFIRFAYKHYPFPLFILAFLNTILSQLIKNPLSLPELLTRIDLRKEKTTSA